MESFVYRTLFSPTINSVNSLLNNYGEKGYSLFQCKFEKSKAHFIFNYDGVKTEFLYQTQPNPFDQKITENLNSFNQRGWSLVKLGWVAPNIYYIFKK